MIIKVCGIKYQDNLDQIVRQPIDLVGLNFYTRSKRFLFSPFTNCKPNPEVKNVGVFVNENVDVILEKIHDYQLDYAQLHGDETPEIVEEISKHIDVIKAFAISASSDFQLTNDYESAALFLFDTKTVDYGGSGNKWGWNLLKHYSGTKPFLLAGGIGPEDVESIMDIDHPQFAGVDINSRFEIEPGRKDVKMVAEFARKCRKNIKLKSS